MKKNKILVIAIAAIISMSNVVPAFADDTALGNSTANTITQTQENQASKEEKFAKLTERAQKLGIDITGLTNEEARVKIREAVALKLGVDITGLAAEDAKAKIQAAMEEKKAETAEKISAKAAALGIDITGLTNEEARSKVHEAIEAKKAEVTQKLTERAQTLGIDITGLTVVYQE